MKFVESSVAHGQRYLIGTRLFDVFYFNKRAHLAEYVPRQHSPRVFLCGVVPGGWSPASVCGNHCEACFACLEGIDDDIPMACSVR